MKRIVTMCDPPSGWKYGFPKVVPEGVDNLTEWLISEGYPQKEIDSYGQYFYTRSWHEEIEE